MTRFSVIVPFIGHVATFEDTLASVLRHKPDDTQVIIVHDGSYNDPHGLEGDVELVAANPNSNLIQLLNVAMQVVDGYLTVFIRPGVEIDENWHESFESAMRDEGVGSVTPILIRSDRPGRIVAAGIEADRTYTRVISGVDKQNSPQVISGIKPIGPASWLGVYRTSVLRAIGPFDEQLDPVYIDLDLGLSIRKLGLQTYVDPDFVATMENDKPLIAELCQPHGFSAQRAVQRFGKQQALSPFRSSFAEILQIPFKTWKLRHLLQRPAAARLQQIDHQFAQKLARAASGQWGPEREVAIKRAA
jgi:hypothetical protein